MLQMEPTWDNLFEASLRKRVDPEDFIRFVNTFQSKYAVVPGRELMVVLLAQHRKPNLVPEDPRLPLYARGLLRSGVCSAADVIASLFSSSSSSSSSESLEGPKTGIDLFDGLNLETSVPRPSVGARIVQMLTLEIAEGLLKSTEEVRDVLKSVVALAVQLPNSNALGYLVSAILSSPFSGDALGRSTSTKSLKSSFARCLSTLIANFSQTNLQLATNLDFWQKQYDLRDDVSAPTLEILNGVDLGALSFQESVLDNTPLNTRAGLYIYLNSMLYGRPIFDDIAVADYLNAKYNGDVTTLVTDLILASFDILANAMYRTEPTESITLLRSFLVNKLPIFLSSYATMIYEPLTMEYCISQALVRVDPAAFPSYSQMFDILGKNGVLSEARQEFLFACALHQLIPEQSIEVLLGDVPMQSLPASGRYVKDNLVAQCSANPTKIEEFIGELENMEGNAGEIAAALNDIIRTLCTNNDTMTLKGVCISLLRKPLALDVVMLFTPSNDFLQPLCHILDNWQEHEDQGLLMRFAFDEGWLNFVGEYQPMYDEFGSILLFIILVQHRFKLQPHDLGIDSPNSFVLSYIKDACMGRSPADLTEHESKLLGGWIRGLFETEGINDELMSMCRPKEFHLLVATLFDQCLTACQFKVLTLENLRGGFEYLREPFLLPSLVAGLTWFAYKLWETKERSSDIEIIMPALETLLKPPSKSSDSASLHSAVLLITTKSLEDSLSYAQRCHPTHQGIGRLLDTLTAQSQKQRYETSFYSELKTWSSTSGGGLLAALRNTIGSLILWSTTPANSAEMSPPHYTHRQLVQTLGILGAKTVMGLLIDEAVAHSDSGGPEVDTVLDIIVTMVSAPQHQNDHPPSTVSLREALQVEFAQAFEMSKTDLNRATMIVRLHRRVEGILGGPGTMDGGGEDGLIHGVVHNADGVPTADIDDVLVEADHQMTQEFLSGSATFIGV